MRLLIYPKDPSFTIGFEDININKITKRPDSFILQDRIISSNKYERNEYLTKVIIAQNVKQISEKAFYMCSSMHSLLIENGLKAISDYAFSKCTTLQKIDMPKSLTHLGKYSFSECFSLTDVSIPDSIQSLEEGTFYRCTSLERITFGNKMRTIGKNVFRGCMELNLCKLPDSVEYLDSFALTYMKITTFHLSKKIRYVDCTNFQNCTYLKDITVEPENDNYYSLNGVLFSKKSIQRYPPDHEGRQYSIPPDIESISDGAFRDSMKLDMIELGAVETIGDYAFASSASLENITIPESVKYIGVCAFDNCNKLKRIVIKNKRPFKIGKYAFGKSCETLILVPKNTKNLFVDNTNWKYYKKYITEVD